MPFIDNIGVTIKQQAAANLHFDGELPENADGIIEPQAVGNVWLYSEATVHAGKFVPESIHPKLLLCIYGDLGSESDYTIELVDPQGGRVPLISGRDRYIVEKNFQAVVPAGYYVAVTTANSLANATKWITMTFKNIFQM